MTRVRNYYELLGVTRTATPAEIRSAYVRLMKIHHPDGAGRDCGRPSLAPVLNQVYATLRDPQSRTRYDTGLAQPQLANASPAPGRRPAAQSKVQRWGTAPVVVGIAIVLGLLVTISFAVDNVAPSLIARQMDSSGDYDLAYASTASRPLPSWPEVRSAAHLARLASFNGATTFSRACFANANRKIPGISADQCVIFDLAFLYWRATPDQPPVPAHFMAHAVHARHREALRVYGSDAGVRLQQLQKQAMSGLLADLKIANQSDARPAITADAAEKVALIEGAPSVRNGVRLSQNDAESTTLEDPSPGIQLRGKRPASSR